MGISEATLTDDEEIKDGMCKAYQFLFSKTGDWRLSIRGLRFDLLGEDRSRSLEVPFSKEEVFEALCSLSGDKALGPDGFTMVF